MPDMSSFVGRTVIVRVIGLAALMMSEESTR
jgi:hypothetical protein